MDERTRLIASATRKDARRRPLNPPIERATTLLNARAVDLRDEELGPTYAISGGQAHAALREALAELEGADQTFLAPTGLSAVTVALMAALSPGDVLICTDAVYWPTRKFCDGWLKRMGIKTVYAPARADPTAFFAVAPGPVRAVLLESPGSLTFEVQDVAALSTEARRRGAVTLVDNTWSAGLLFKPLAHGATASIQALSKYVGGASDVFGGSIAVSDPDFARRIDSVIDQMGWYVSPDDAWLALRGLRTLPVRLAEHGRTALAAARWLEMRPEVARVFYPPLPSSPDHHLWKRDFSGGCGLLSLELAPPGDRLRAEAMLDALSLFGVGFSWGGYESLATWENPQIRRRSLDYAITGPLVRLHFGLERLDDLLADLDTGLKAYAEA